MVLAPDGEELWRSPLDVEDPYRRPMDVLPGPAGGVRWVTGSASSQSGNDILALEYSADGTESWSRRIDLPQRAFEMGFAIAVDGVPHARTELRPVRGPGEFLAARRHERVELVGRHLDVALVLEHLGSLVLGAAGHRDGVLAVLGKIGRDRDELGGPVQALVLVARHADLLELEMSRDVRQHADRDQHGDGYQQELAPQR